MPTIPPLGTTRTIARTSDKSDDAALARLTAAVERLTAASERLTIEITALRSDLVSSVRARSSLSRADRQRLTTLLPAITGALGSELFFVAELFESDDAPALRIVTRDISPLHMGRLLRRAVGHPVDGRIVERVGTEAHRVLWRVTEVVGVSS